MSSMFGGNNYSTVPHTLSHDQICRLVSQTRISSLSQHELKIVEDALTAGRTSSGMISLTKIDEILLHLQSTRQISSYDRSGVMKVFQTYLGTR